MYHRVPPQATKLRRKTVHSPWVARCGPLLTAEAIAARGLSLAGWVANHVDPDMAAADENVRALEARIPARLLARISYAPRANARAVASQFDPARLQ